MPRRAGVRRPFGAHAIAAVILASLIATGLVLAERLAPVLTELEHFAADYRSAWLADTSESPHPSIVVVTVSEDALARHAGHPYRSPTDRAVLARLIGIVDRAQPLAIGLDYIFDRPTEAAKDDALRAAIRTARHPLVVGVADARAGLTAEQVAYQDGMVGNGGAVSGHLSLTYERDGVVRYMSRPDPAVPVARQRPSFAEQLATIARATGRTPGGERPARITVAHRQERIAWLRVEGASAETSFRTVPAVALLDADADPRGPVAVALARLLKDRIVVIGGEFEDLDRHETPLKAVGAGKLAGVMVHAHMVAQLIDDRRVIHAPRWVQSVLLFVLAFVGLAVGHLYDVDRSAQTIGIVVLVLLDIAVFVGFRTVMPFSLPLFAWLGGTMFGRHLDRLGGPGR